MDFTLGSVEKMSLFFNETGKERGGRVMNVREIVGFAALLILSLFLRLHYLSDMEYKIDERMAYNMAGDVLEQGRLPLFGIPSSLAIPNPPGFVVLVAFFRRLVPSPLGVAGIIAVVNALSIVFFAAFMRKRVSPFVLWTAAFFLATSPWAVILSRKIWAQDLLMPFAILLMFSTVKVLQDRKPAYWPLMALALLGMAQLHLSSLYLGLALPAAVIWSHARFSKQDYLFMGLGLLLLIIPCLPYALYIMNTFRDCLKNVDSSRKMGPLTQLIETGRGLLRVASIYSLEPILRTHTASFRNYFGKILSPIIWLVHGGLIVAAVGGSIALLKRVRRDFLMKYVMVTVGSMVFYLLIISTRTGIIYMVALFPAIALLLGWGVESIRFERLRNAVAVVFVAASVLVTLGFQDFIRIHDGVCLREREAYGVPYRLQATSQYP